MLIPPFGASRSWSLSPEWSILGLGSYSSHHVLGNVPYRNSVCFTRCFSMCKKDERPGLTLWDSCDWDGRWVSDIFRGPEPEDAEQKWEEFWNHA